MELGSVVFKEHHLNLVKRLIPSARNHNPQSAQWLVSGLCVGHLGEQVSSEGPRAGFRGPGARAGPGVLRKRCLSHLVPI